LFNLKYYEGNIAKEKGKQSVMKYDLDLDGDFEYLTDILL